MLRGRKVCSAEVRVCSRGFGVRSSREVGSRTLMMIQKQKTRRGWDSGVGEARWEYIYRIRMIERSRRVVIGKTGWRGRRCCERMRAQGEILG